MCNNIRITKSYPVKLLLLVLAVLYSLSFLFWGGGVDKYYWIIHTDYYQYDVMNILSFYIGSIWKSIVGGNDILFRLLGWLLSMAAIAVPYLLLQPKEERINNLNYLTVGIILFGFWSYQMYSYDAMTVFSLSLLTSCTIRFNKYSLKSIFWLALITSLSVASRLPNFLSIIVVASYLLFHAKQSQVRNRYMYPLAYVVMSIAMYVIIICAFKQNIDIIGILQSAFNNVQNQLGESHSSLNLIKSYYHSFVYCIQHIPTFICFFGLTYFFAEKIFNNIFLRYSIYALFYILLFWFGGTDRYFYELFFSFCIVLLLAISSYKKHPNIDFVTPLFMAFMIPLCAAGSDTGFMKFFLLSACFSPLVIKEFDEYLRNQVVKAFFVLFVIFSIIICNLSLFEEFNVTPEKEIMVKAEKSFNRYGRTDKTIFWGKTFVHQLYYDTKSKLPYNNGFHQVAQSEVSNIIKIMQNNHDFVLYDFSNHEEFKKALLNNGYDIVFEDKDFTIYSASAK